MDVVIPFRHSSQDDEELRYTLRSYERHLKGLGKVWLLGDRPTWLTEDAAIIEHVPHEQLVRGFGFRTPVRSYFLLTFLGSVISELSPEYVQGMDDAVLLEPVDSAFLRIPRAVEDLERADRRGRGPWRDSLWFTHDSLLRLGYPGVNYEAHIPLVYRRSWVWDAYCTFADFVSEDPLFGMVGPTAIFNYRMRHEPFQPTWLLEEGRFIGIYGDRVMGANPDALKRAGIGPAQPGELLLQEQIRALCEGKAFLNFDETGFSVAMHQFLEELFPEPSRFERPESEDEESVWRASPSGADFAQNWPPIIMSQREDFPAQLNRWGLVGEGAEVGTLEGRFAATLLKTWRGRRLHCVDPWKATPNDRAYLDVNNVSQMEHDRNYRAATRLLASYGDRCRIHRLPSAEAVKHFSERSLDFVYLDGRHYRAGVEEDLTLWAPLVRSGGVLCGHDYLDGDLPSGRFAVKSAVDAFAKARGLAVGCSGEPLWRSWFIRMP